MAIITWEENKDDTPKKKYEDLEAGTYTAVCSDYGFKADYNQFTFTFEITDGPHTGRLLFCNHSLNPAAIWAFAKNSKVLGLGQFFDGNKFDTDKIEELGQSAIGKHATMELKYTLRGDKKYSNVYINNLVGGDNEKEASKKESSKKESIKKESLSKEKVGMPPKLDTEESLPF